MRRMILGLASATALVLVPVAGPTHADPSITPSSVEALVYPGESFEVDKEVGTPTLPPKLDICLVEDESGSYFDDIAILQGVASEVIYDTVVAAAPDSQFAVAGFRDYPVFPYGDGGDWAYRLVQAMDPDRQDWLDAVDALTAGGGGDGPESQYDAIVAAAGSAAGDCGWRADPDVTRVMLVATDAPFHIGPDGTHIHNHASTLAALTAQGITLIGLEASGATNELDLLAAATGGSVQGVGAGGAQIAAAILAGLGNLPIDVSLVSDCTPPISTSFSPTSSTVTSGTAAYFVETISVAAGAAGGTYECNDVVHYDGTAADPALVETKTIHVPGIALTPPTATNELTAGESHTVTATVSAGTYGPVAGVRVEFEVTSGPNTGASGEGTTDASGEVTFTWSPGAIDPAHLGTDTVVATFTDDDDSVDYGSASAEKNWVDTTPPTADCVETVNPAGKNVPSAPGKGGQGQNQDGYYELNGTDEVWGTAGLDVYVVDSGTGTVFGPFAVGTKIKYTEANGATPSISPIGGPGSAVAWHIKGQGDATLTVVDGSGNTSTDTCLVPPKPK